MQCKILTYSCNRTEFGSIESNINKWLAAGWRIEHVSYVDIGVQLLVFMVK